MGSYGNTAKVESTKKFAFQRHIAHIKPNHQIIRTDFLLGSLESNAIRQQIDSSVKGIAQKTLNLADLKMMRIYLPDL
ncbi:MAG: restriction endonuclease subunit S, partial [Leptolyngbyaceae cyanobacterium CSU_1_3]|nr:restriction endonuclease subunit S [Leptolyngbyaceae cyanobacterium CSU_1_3]